MKKTKALSICAAALMVSAVAASVGATDYSSDPGYTLPDYTPSTNSTTNNRVGTGESPAPSTDSSSDSSSDSASDTTTKVATTISTSDVSAAIAEGTAITASSTQAAIKSTAIAELASTEGATLTVVTSKFTVTIDSSSVTDAKDIDLGMKITKNSDKGALILSTAQSGEYGCTVKMAIPAKVYEQAGVDLSKAAVYVVDPETGKAVKYADLELDEDGNIILEIVEGGKYIIL